MSAADGVDAPARAGQNCAVTLRMGVSACLLGAEVRFDGQHKRDAFLTEDLAPFVEWVSVCPEVEADMGVPREPVRLLRRGGGPPSMVGQPSGTDFTERMNDTVARRVEALARQDLRGYVLKSKSPSCGLLRVNLYDVAAPGAAPKQLGVGLFAQALVERLPNLPVEEEGRLHDAGLRENFIERVFAYDRLRALFDVRFTIGALVAFHTAHKMQLLAHSTDGYRALGHLVGQAKALPRGELRTRYEADFMAVLKRPATRGRQANVLTHMFGHLRKVLPESDKRELLDLIEDHRTGLIPLIVPVTLLRHHVRRLGVAYLAGQTFLEPHPKELMLRNHA